MSDTNVENFDPNALVDMFPDLSPVAPKTGIGFSQDPPKNPDMFSVPEPPKAPVVTPPADTPPVVPTATEPDREEADLLGTGETPAPAKVEKKELSDLTAYYTDRIKNGKFVAINEEDDKGNIIGPFIPKTAEEYDEVLEIQINHRLAEARKEVEQKWYDSKSPAWKFVSQYSEMVDDPSELIPILSGVRAIQSVAEIDENDAEGAERIVRARYAQKGDPDEIINSQIEALKSTDKLIPTAKQYKPLIIQQEQHAISQRVKQVQQQEQEYRLLINDIKEKALVEIEKPIFGSTKLKQEEKAAIYDLIAEPAEDTQGYGIYNVIDRLFDTRDFKTLRKVALLLAKEESFFNYFGVNIADQTAASLQTKLRIAGESRTTSGNDFDETKQAPVTRNTYKSKPSFGRG